MRAVIDRLIDVQLRAIRAKQAKATQHLARCPSCNGTPHHTFDLDSGMKSVTCSACGLLGPSRTSRAEADKAWDGQARGWNA